jgi:flagellar basal-body rod modification protein FlgD
MSSLFGINLGATGSTGQTTSAAGGAGGGATSVNQNEFVQLLVAELQNQDPLQPMDPTSFLTQMTQFEALDQLSAVAKAVQSMATAASVEQGVALLGRTVTYQAADGSAQSGTVTAVSIQQGSVSLQVGNESVPLSAVVAVHG